MRIDGKTLEEIPKDELLRQYGIRKGKIEDLRTGIRDTRGGYYRKFAGHWDASGNELSHDWEAVKRRHGISNQVRVAEAKGHIDDLEFELELIGDELVERYYQENYDDKGKDRPRKRPRKMSKLTAELVRHDETRKAEALRKEKEERKTGVFCRFFEKAESNARDFDTCGKNSRWERNLVKMASYSEKGRGASRKASGGAGANRPVMTEDEFNSRALGSKDALRYVSRTLHNPNSPEEHRRYAAKFLRNNEGLLGTKYPLTPEELKAFDSARRAERKASGSGRGRKRAVKGKPRYEITAGEGRKRFGYKLDGDGNRVGDLVQIPYKYGNPDLYSDGGYGRRKYVEYDDNAQIRMDGKEFETLSKEEKNYHSRVARSPTFQNAAYALAVLENPRDEKTEKMVRKHVRKYDSAYFYSRKPWNKNRYGRRASQ